MLGNLAATKAERITEFKKRKQRHDQIRSQSTDADRLVQAGWDRSDRVLKDGRILLRKTKLHDEILENRFWSVMYHLGYDELNIGRKFTIQITDSRVGKEVVKQIDVFAKDEDTIVVTECKSSEKKSNRSLQKDIMEFSALQKSFVKSILCHYGKENKFKFIWLIVTRNIVISDADKKRAKHENIQIIQDKELRYYEEIAKNIGRAAKYQFLAEFLEGSVVRNLENHVVPAIRSKIGGCKAYYFLVSPYRLLPIAFVNHRSLRDPSGYPTYQRLIKRARLKQIGSFLESGGYFPNSILVNFKTKVRFDIHHSYEEKQIYFGDLYLPDKYKSAWIIDGQHRLYGYTETTERQKNCSIAVVAFEGVPRTVEAELFSTINGKQAKVSRNILDELEGDLKFDSKDQKERMGAIAARALAWLDAETGSPFNDRMKTPETEESDVVCLTISELKKGVVSSGLLGRIGAKDRPNQPGPITRNTSEETLDALCELLSAYFDAIRQSNLERWDCGRPGHICMNIGIIGHVRLLSNLIDYMSIQTRQDANNLEPTEIIEQILPYIRPVLDFIASASDVEFEERFKPIFGSGGPPRYFYELTRLVHDIYPSFIPPGYEEYQNTRSSEESRRADERVRRINERVHHHVVHILREAHGPSFFTKGIPQKEIRMKALDRQQDAKVDDQLPPETYLDIMDLKKIIEHAHNWPRFEKTLSIQTQRDRKGLAKYVSWFDQFNEIRKIMAHPANRSYKESDLEFLNFIESELEKRLS